MEQETEATEAALRRAGVIAILRGGYSVAQVVASAVALVDGGVRALEVTLNSPAALEGIAALHRALPADILVGAGTVRNPADVRRALDAGAAFLIAPGLDPASVQEARARGTLLLPGVLTPSEALAAAAIGCRLLKLFPASIGGPGYLRAIRAPLDDLQFVPTGGVRLEMLRAYREAGAAAVAVGSELTGGPSTPGATLRERAAAFVAAWEEATDG